VEPGSSKSAFDTHFSKRLKVKGQGQELAEEQSLAGDASSKMGCPSKTKAFTWMSSDNVRVSMVRKDDKEVL
jgi:hypothetical protein